MQIIRVQSCNENPFPFSQGVSTVLFILTNSVRHLKACEWTQQVSQPWKQTVWGSWGIPEAPSPALLLPHYKGHCWSTSSTEPTQLHQAPSCLHISIARRYTKPQNTQEQSLLPLLQQHPGTKLCSSRRGCRLVSWEVKHTAGQSAQGWSHTSWNKGGTIRGSPTGATLLPHCRAPIPPIQCCWRVSHQCVYSRISLLIPLKQNEKNNVASVCTDSTI